LAVPFTYPAESRDRSHGPSGYAHYESYRPWLRDEFTFRCVYCLIREQWGRVTGEFDIEHFVAQSRNADLGTAYGNLVYSCRSCNLLKGDREVPDPRLVLTGNQVLIKADGSIEGLTADAKRLILVLGLDADSYLEWRLIWIRLVELAREHDSEQYRRLMGFPDDIPNLHLLRPPGGNSRPEGIETSYFAKRERGELPEVY
jgi:hypothetical protein